MSFALAFAPNLAVAAVVIAPLGFAGIAFAITGNSTLQLTSAPDRRGRVMALYTVVFLGSTPIGGPLAGWVGQHISASFGFAAGGVIAVATGLAALAALTRGAHAAPRGSRREPVVRRAGGGRGHRMKGAMVGTRTTDARTPSR